MFASGREAKKYLVERIVEEARREDVPLSEIETKMLYFSETAWTLPDILEVNETFEREYDEVEYEQKVAGLIRSFRVAAHERDTKELASWDEAVRVLSREDHYFLVLIGVADGKFKAAGAGDSEASWRRFLKLVAMGGGLFLVCAVILMLFLFFKSRTRP